MNNVNCEIKYFHFQKFLFCLKKAYTENKIYIPHLFLLRIFYSANREVFTSISFSRRSNRELNP
jgi:hypothetical protein